jgi:hypothetical protein
VRRGPDTEQTPGAYCFLHQGLTTLEMEMNGALMKASSSFAIAAALGLVLGAGSVRAADLGGNCCADLEERIAELEATTARKGNRKMSLTITGQIDRVILWWNDGQTSRAYYGLDNTNSSTRFSLLGSAKVNPSVSMGFEIMMEIEAGGTSSKVSQLDEDGKLGTQLRGSATTGTGSFNASNVDAYFGDARRAAGWIEHKDLGRLTIGRFESAGVIQIIDLGGIGLAGGSSFILLNGGFFLRGPTGQYFNMTWGNIGDPASAQGRTELVRWDSPSWHGFILTSSVAEAGDFWGTMLRYANEFHGFRVAAGIGFEQVRDKFTTDLVNVNYDQAGTPSVNAWGGGLSVMHVSSGLFAQAFYNAISFGNGTSTDGLSPPGTPCTNSSAPSCTSGYWGQNQVNKDDATHWLVQGGIAKNWFGYGNTAVYGEFGRATGWGGSFAGRDYAGLAGSPNVGVFGVIDTRLDVWGLGITQNFDAAATQLYLGYRHMDANINCARDCLTRTGLPGTLSVEGIDVVVGGMRVLF